MGLRCSEMGHSKAHKLCTRLVECIHFMQPNDAAMALRGMVMLVDTHTAIDPAIRLQLLQKVEECMRDGVAEEMSPTHLADSFES